MSSSTHRAPVVVAGGGIGALETVLALSAAAGERAAITLVTPQDAYVHRPMAVAEPFGLGTAARLPLATLARTHGITLRHGRVAAIDGERRVARLDDGDELPYEALVVATGAQAHDWLPGALHFAGPPSVAPMRALLERIAAREVSRIAFCAPPGAGWTLPLYELALLTASWLADRDLTDVRLSVVTPEVQPLAAFGRGARRVIRDLLADRGIALHAGVTTQALAGGRLELSNRVTLPADAVVTLPRLTGAAPAGIPCDRDGFVHTGRDGAVEELPGVHVVGDLTASPLKQGGLAAQAADAAAAAIAVQLGADVHAPLEEPVLRGLLLTGVAPAYLSGPSGGHADGRAAFRPIWGRPGKVAGRFLSAYLADTGVDEGAVAVPCPIERDHAPARRLALDLAHTDARAGDRPSALRWLDAADWLDDDPGHPETSALRRAWSDELARVA